MCGASAGWRKKRHFLEGVPNGPCSGSTAVRSPKCAQRPSACSSHPPSDRHASVRRCDPGSPPLHCFCCVCCMFFMSCKAPTLHLIPHHSPPPCQRALHAHQSAHAPSMRLPVTSHALFLATLPVDAATCTAWRPLCTSCHTAVLPRCQHCAASLPEQTHRRCSPSPHPSLLHALLAHVFSSGGCC